MRDLGIKLETMNKWKNEWIDWLKMLRRKIYQTMYFNMMLSAFALSNDFSESPGGGGQSTMFSVSNVN